MCGRFTLAARLEEIGRQFDVDAQLEDYHASYNIAPSLDIAVVRPDPDKGRELCRMRWGLIPRWAKEAHTKYRMINAKAETLDQKPAYREAFKYRRCLIPADGFYEWKAEGKGKQPYFIQLTQGGLFAFAGLWERWSDGRQSIDSCTIITTEASETVRAIHDRMPVIVDPGDYPQWLDPQTQDAASLKPLLQTARQPSLSARAVSKQVNKPDNDSPQLIQPIQ